MILSVLTTVLSKTTNNGNPFVFVLFFNRHSYYRSGTNTSPQVSGLTSKTCQGLTPWEFPLPTPHKNLWIAWVLPYLWSHNRYEAHLVGIVSPEGGILQVFIILASVSQGRVKLIQSNHVMKCCPIPVCEAGQRGRGRSSGCLSLPHLPRFDVSRIVWKVWGALRLECWSLTSFAQVKHEAEGI